MFDLSKKLTQAKKTEIVLQNLSQKIIDKCLVEIAEQLIKQQSKILSANKLDLKLMNINDPMYDRVLLTPERIKAIIKSLQNIKKLKSNVGKILEEKKLKNGIKLQKVSVPLGMVGVIYEARPNVTIDVFALCFKSKNIAILKCGTQAFLTSQEFVKIIHEVLVKNNLPSDFCVLLPADRKITDQLLKANSYVDVLIPRGGAGLIKFVRENALIPVIETGAGVCHTYVDKDAKLEMAGKIIFNAKTRRPSVCNTLDTLLIHSARIADLPFLVKNLAKKEVEIFADKLSYKYLDKKYPKYLLKLAKENDFGREFLSLKMAIKTVNNVKDAVGHINFIASKHSEAIITGNDKVAEYFLKNVDAANVYHNTSTAFSDGFEFGMGGEIGISTQKLHARGPMGLNELSTYKWVGRGRGQIRN